MGNRCESYRVGSAAKNRSLRRSQRSSQQNNRVVYSKQNCAQDRFDPGTHSSNQITSTQNNQTNLAKLSFMTADEMKATCICDGRNLYDYVEAGQASAYKIDGKKLIQYNNGCSYIQGDCGWTQLTETQAKLLKDFQAKFKKVDIPKAVQMMQEAGAEANSAGVRANYINNFYEHNGSLIYIAPSGSAHKFNKGKWEKFDIDSKAKPQVLTEIKPKITPEAQTATEQPVIETTSPNRTDKDQPIKETTTTISKQAKPKLPRPLIKAPVLQNRPSSSSTAPRLKAHNTMRSAARDRVLGKEPSKIQRLDPWASDSDPFQ